jgi:hypothetical protein
MTILEAYKFKVGNDVSDADAIAALQFVGLDPDATWDANDNSTKCTFYGAVLNALSANNMGIKQESEGGYSITYDSAMKGKYLENLANESGCQELMDKYSTVPVIKNKSYLW